MDEVSITTVFVSYSHDSPEHKRWVTEFSSNLIKNGINVILDQWDLGLGDDIPKFMEKSVSSADRVLMVCTEPYVHKADDGKGGVGYEAMIVTGELVRNLGTSKFIPVIRQEGTNKILPKSVATRFYVDMSLDDPAQFELLLRELHQVPALEKPALGKNPFAKSPSGEELPVVNPWPLQIENAADPANIYGAAIEVARAGDILQWRELTRTVRKNIASDLAAWRAKYPSAPSTKEALVEQSIEGIRIFAPIIALALAGVGSGREKFANQVSLFEELLNPKDWNRSGYTVIVELPSAAAFVYQALYGAMCLYTDQASHAISMIRSRVKFFGGNENIPIWNMHKVMGWPSSLGESSTDAWNVLASLPEKYPWVVAIFGDAEDYLVALVAYYITLNINEYAYALKNNHESFMGRDRMHLDIPLAFLFASDDVKRKAYRLVLQDQNQIMDIWHSLGITDDRFSKHWEKWIGLCNSWLNSGGRYWSMSPLVHANLPTDMQLAS